MLVYKATFPNNRRYIGITKGKLQQRIKNHLKSAALNSSLLFHKAIRKYSNQNIRWQIIEDNIEDYEYLKERQRFNILKYRTYMLCEGYNMTLGGDGNEGQPLSQNTKKKLRLANLGKKQSLWSVIKRSARMKENPIIWTQQMRNKASQQKMGYKNPMYGKVNGTIWTEQMKLNQSKKIKEYHRRIRGTKHVL